MRRIAGVLFVFLIFSLAPAAAQSPQYRRGGPPPAREECPQGRQIRAQKPYPASMTDCQVLDADTAAENRRLGARSPPGRTQYGDVQPSAPARQTDSGTAAAAAARAAAAKVLQNADWQPLEADNGAVYKLDMNSIKPGNGGAAQITVYADEGRPTDIALNLKFLLFDCKGRFLDMGAPMSQSAYAPPKSVAGQIGAIACARAQAATAEIDAESARRGRSPEEYCKGFSSDACDRMKLTIDTKQAPPYCKKGFALVGSGLSAEQLRICYVMTATAFTVN